ncbi:MAG: hypothetical protein AAGC93_15390 [Cyanobacteria bacterium P01_F01_bin.53]
MAKACSTPKRYRGYVLTYQGVDKLQQRLSNIEKQTCIRQNARTISDRVRLTEAEGIHQMTVRKILRQQQGVDKASIERVFQALGLSLEMADCAHANLYNKAPKLFR